MQPKVDWHLKADTLVCEKAVLEEEKAELVKKNLDLAEQLKDIQSKFQNVATSNCKKSNFTGYREKAIQYQEDLDQLEGFQSQEIAKVKHLVSACKKQP